MAKGDKKIKKVEEIVEGISESVIEQTVEQTVETTIEEIIKPIIKPTIILPREVRLWKEYLIKLQTTPEEFIKRYPNHPLKEIILKINQ